MKKRFSILCIFTLLMFIFVPAAQATLFYFTSDHMSGGYGSSGPFGTVELTQNGADVDFVVTLNDGSWFIRTGAGDDFNFKFNIAGDTGAAADENTITGTGITGSYYIGTGKAYHGDGGGTFYYGVYFTGQGTNGGSDAMPGPLKFTVEDVTIAELTGLNDKDQIFVADVISGVTKDPTTGKPNGNTGLIDVSNTPVPLPGALWFLGSGLLGLVGVRRRITKA